MGVEMGWELQDERTNEQAERKHRTKPKAYNERRASADRDEIIINKTHQKSNHTGETARQGGSLSSPSRRPPRVNAVLVLRPHLTTLRRPALHVPHHLVPVWVRMRVLMLWWRRWRGGLRLVFNLPWGPVCVRHGRHRGRDASLRLGRRWRRRRGHHRHHGRVSLIPTWGTRLVLGWV